MSYQGPQKPAVALRRITKAGRVRILLVNRHFHSVQVPTARMMRDVADRLLAAGHEVVVLTSHSNYVDLGKSSPIHSGAQVLHAPMFPERFRLFNWLLFLLWAGVRVPWLRWDRCVLLTDPPYLVVVAWIVQQIHGRRRKIYWWTMDLYPEALVSRGMVKAGQGMDRALRAVNERALRCLDGVVCLGECQLQRLSLYRNWKCVAPRVRTIPPWDYREVKPVARPNNRVLQQLGLQDRRVALYAGNLGEAHLFHSIVEAARLAAADKESCWSFVFAVRGGKAGRLKDAAHHVPNVHVCEYFPETWTADLLWSADVHLITMEKGWEGVVVPSKLYAAIKTRAPVVFVGPESSDTAREIVQHGLGRVLPAEAGGGLLLETLNGILREPRRLETPRMERGDGQVASFVTEV